MPDLEGRLPQPVLPGPQGGVRKLRGRRLGFLGGFIATVKPSVLGVTRDISVLSSEGAWPSPASLFPCPAGGCCSCHRVGGLGQLSQLPSASVFFSVKMGCEE